MIGLVIFILKYLIIVIINLNTTIRTEINFITLGDWDFRNSDLVKNPKWNWYLVPVMNFSKVRRVQLAKSTLLTSTLVTQGSF